MIQTHTPAQYVVTYANSDGETIQRGPVSASEALAIADDVTPHLPSWADSVSFYLEGDYDGEITITREELSHEASRGHVALGFVTASPDELSTANLYGGIGGEELRDSALVVPSFTESLLVAINSARYPYTREFLALASFRVRTPDMWGNTIFATIFYSTDGEYVSQWGGHGEDGAIVWQCYAD